jgi:hypothetical protein
MRQLDRAAGELNPFLLAVSIGLVVLYTTSLFGLILKLPVTQQDICVQTSASAAHEAHAK